MMLIKYFQNIACIPSLTLFILRCYKQQKQFMKESILLILEDFKKHHDQSLSEKDFKKISFYYGLAVPVIGEIFCSLRGEKINHTERKTLTYLGGLTGLFDDFFDEKDTPHTHIQKLINHPNDQIGRNSHEKLFIQFYLQALNQKQSNLIKKYSNAVYDAQVLSKKQTDTKLSSEEILHITQQKGGVSILFYRCALEGDINEHEKELLFNIGLLGQLENDIFDIYKDYQEGISTLATRAASIKNLHSQYKSILNTIFALIEQSDYPKRNKKKFSRFVSIIASRGLVCLDQLIKLEQNGLFEVSKCSRKDLICDMGNFKNTIRWIGYYLNWNN